MVEIPRSIQFDDIYFAVEDGLAESRYVFLQKNNLPQGWQDRDYFIIAETGFGTGLNFLCAWKEFEETTRKDQQLHYYSFEKFPLSAGDLLKYLQHWSQEFGGRLERLVELYPLRIGGWHTIRVSPQVTLTLILDDVNRALPELHTKIDCWFLDGHAPAKNPDMWSETVFHHIGRLSQNGTRLATFTAAGFVRRGLQDAGFKISKDRGFGRKRDMTVGVFESPNPRETFSGAKKNIAVIGGGIAGCSLAYSLAEQGCTISLYEKNGLASGGSGNIRGLCNPRITALRGHESDFYSAGFALSQRRFREISKVRDIGYAPCGSLHLITDETKEKRYRSFCENWGWHDDHARILSASDASEIAGVQLQHQALYLPDAALVSPSLLTQALPSLATGAVQIIAEDVENISNHSGCWQIGSKQFDAVILACGHDVLQFPWAATLPLQKIRGQVTRARVSGNYTKLQTNLCYGGYASLPFEGEAVIGSTFQHWIDDLSLRPEDDTENIRKLSGVAPDLVHDIEQSGARAGFRCAAKDRVPVIGPAQGVEGLYLATAYGSHGIVTAMIAAAYLTAKICHLPQILPENLDQFISPSRFQKTGN